jgi:transaldolase
LRAAADHGHIPQDSVRGHYADARLVIRELEALGIDYDDVTTSLADRGPAAFDASWRELGDELAAKLRHQEGPSAEEESGA